jgi:hypothetical protein
MIILIDIESRSMNIFEIYDLSMDCLD